MSDSVYTAQDRANEGCCWTYYRDHCPGGGCLCDCHATNEEILLSDRARLRREVDRERQAFAELTTASVARIEQLTARAEAAEQQAARLRAALRDFESNGIRADCNPTVPLEGRDTAWWYAYIANADLRVRERARAALAASQPAPAAEAGRGGQAEGDG